MYLLAICTSSLENYLFNLFAHLLTGLLDFWYLAGKKFSILVHYLFILVIDSFEQKLFSLMLALCNLSEGGSLNS
jgi:hypothetical protein